LTDITEHRTDDGKLYLCAIKDVYSNRIVGYSIDTRMKASLAVAALDHAITTRSPVATIIHSDRASQFRSRKFVHALSRNGLRDRWAGLVHVWNRSSRSRNATSWIGNGGPPEPNCAWRS
jgi:transposase InsO family protein